MSNFDIDDEYKERLDFQFEKWVAFLNTGTGLLSFILALLSLGTPTPTSNSFLSLIVVISVRGCGAQLFPQEIQALRKEAKTNPSAKSVLDGLEERHLSIKAIFKKYRLFVFGIVLLFCLTISNTIIKFYPAWAGYVGI